MDIFKNLGVLIVDIMDIQLKTKEKLLTPMGEVNIFNIQKLEELGLGKIHRLPYSHRVLLENVLRNIDGKLVTEDHLRAMCLHEFYSKILQEYLPLLI